ncbi:hypothetical protein [Streptomyces sp. NPDC049590]|uniref:hypothetical protein n=1 Tax=Streptomyces sp. NPDC049590 TaxID=3154834 RepID=UPI00343703B1
MAFRIPLTRSGPHLNTVTIMPCKAHGFDSFHPAFTHGITSAVSKLCPAVAKGNHGGRPEGIDDDSLLFARALKDRGVPVPEIAGKLTINTGKNASKHSSVGSLYRALAEDEDTAEADGVQIVGPRRPVRARITGPDPMVAGEGGDGAAFQVYGAHGTGLVGRAVGRRPAWPSSRPRGS